MRRRDFLGVGFTVGTSDQVLGVVKRTIEGGLGPRVFMHCNAHTLRCAARHAGVDEAMRSGEATVLFEGIGLKLAALLKGRGLWPDVNGTDLVPRVLQSQFGQPLRVAFVGAEPGVAERAADRLRGPWLLCAALDGYGSIADEEALLATLAAAEPDLVLLALGTPLQEPTAIRWARRLPRPVFWCVGGLFDMAAGDVPRAPFAVRRLRCEWLWRFMMDPARLWPRIVIGAPWLLSMLFADGRGAHPNPQGNEEVSRPC